jgi:hypothetical protein
MLGIISNEILVFLFLLFFSSPFKKNKKKFLPVKRKSESGLPKLTAPLNRLFSIEMSTKAFTMSSIHQKLFFNLQSNPIQKKKSFSFCLFVFRYRKKFRLVCNNPAFAKENICSFIRCCFNSLKSWFNVLEVSYFLVVLLMSLSLFTHYNNFCHSVRLSFSLCLYFSCLFESARLSFSVCSSVFLSSLV